MIGTIKQGDTVRVNGSVVFEDGTPKDITGATILFSLARANGNGFQGPTIITKTTDNGTVIITDGPGGLYEFTLTRDETSNYDDNGTETQFIGQFYYEVLVQDTLDQSATIVCNTFKSIDTINA